MDIRSARPLDRYFAGYSGDHSNATNQAIHVVAVPAILWSAIALLWCVPPLLPWFQHGIWAPWRCSAPGPITTACRARWASAC